MLTPKDAGVVAGIILYMRPAIFLDRDGVIIENRDNYVRNWQDVKFLPGALQALSRLSESPYAVIIITNQSAVGRGMITLEQAQEINRRVVEVIVETCGRIDSVYMCPHGPDDQCACRKPKPGLLTQAAEEHNLDLSQSVLVGDALTDLLAGQAAGLSANILVLTGRGKKQNRLPEAAKLFSYTVCDTLVDAVEVILNELPV